MPDKYSGYAELISSEPHGAWRLRHEDRGSDVLVIAPHAGMIEHDTGEIAIAIAGDDLSYYLFEGRKHDHNRDLHLASARFDEPTALEMCSRARLVVAVHGKGVHDEIAYVGGGRRELVSALCAALIAAGFEAREETDPELGGRESRNLCNRGAGGGLQLELGSSLRHRLGGQEIRRAEFAAAVRSVVLARADRR
jgi:phage replication-related protein YjqB (UPF0714/DUF867 family)